MSELIERQATIDAVNNAFDRETLLTGLVRSIAVRAIRDMPSAQPEPQWIPVGERLPDTNRDVLLQFSTSMGVGFWEHNSWGVNTGDNIYSEIGEGEARPIAWMPLPEPYKPNK